MLSSFGTFNFSSIGSGVPEPTMTVSYTRAHSTVKFPRFSGEFALDGARAWKVNSLEVQLNWALADPANLTTDDQIKTIESKLRTMGTQTLTDTRSNGTTRTAQAKVTSFTYNRLIEHQGYIPITVVWRVNSAQWTRPGWTIGGVTLPTGWAVTATGPAGPYRASQVVSPFTVVYFPYWAGQLSRNFARQTDPGSISFTRTVGETDMYAGDPWPSQPCNYDCSFEVYSDQGVSTSNGADLYCEMYEDTFYAGDAEYNLEVTRADGNRHAYAYLTTYSYTLGPDMLAVATVNMGWSVPESAWWNAAENTPFEGP